MNISHRSNWQNFETLECGGSNESTLESAKGSFLAEATVKSESPISLGCPIAASSAPSLA